MNKLTIIGNLTRDPELRTVNTANGEVNVCSFTLAVNNRRGSRNGQEQTDFFRCTAWRGLGETIAKYMHKGQKMCVVGSVSVRTYQAQDGTTRASLEVTVDDCEFLTPRGDGAAFAGAPSAPAASAPAASNGGFEEVDDEELPF